MFCMFTSWDGQNASFKIDFKSLKHGGFCRDTVSRSLILCKLSTRRQQHNNMMLVLDVYCDPLWSPWLSPPMQVRSREWREPLGCSPSPFGNPGLSLFILCTVTKFSYSGEKVGLSQRVSWMGASVRIKLWWENTKGDNKSRKNNGSIWSLVLRMCYLFYLVFLSFQLQNSILSWVWGLVL